MTPGSADEHTAVLVEEALAALAVQPAGYYLDATFGRGGHSARILAALGPAGRLLALDRDPDAIAAGRARFAGDARLVLVQGEFADLEALWRAQFAARDCDGLLFDLGVSSPQLDQPGRGFSFQHDGPLDMRMDPTQGASAADWLNRARQDEIRDVIATLGEERFAGRVASAIVAARQQRPLTRTAELAAVIARAVRTREPGKHPATRSFQAIRMHVNDELGQIARALEQALRVLAAGGRLVVISFHSLEDRLVKNFLRAHATVDPVLAGLPVIPESARPPLRLVGRKQRAGSAELAANPRARSAVLRVAEKPAVRA